MKLINYSYLSRLAWLEALELGWAFSPVRFPTILS